MKASRRRATALSAGSVVLLAGGVHAGPPGDYGDAPVGEVWQGIQAYPGVLARWVSYYQHTSAVTSGVQHNNGTWLNPGATFQLGVIGPGVYNDTPQNPGSPENDSRPIIGLDALGASPTADLEVRVSTSPLHNESETFYLSVLIDSNGDGQWRDGKYLDLSLAGWFAEWVVRDMPISLKPGQLGTYTIRSIRVPDPMLPKWMRLVLADHPIGTVLSGQLFTSGGSQFWDGTMPQVHGWKGEIEDFRLDFEPPGVIPGTTAGVWRKQLLGWTGGGGGGGGKPVCAVNFKGPFRMTVNWCDLGFTRFNLNYNFNSFSNGCGINPNVLWGMYGLKHLEGVLGPPTVAVANPGLFGARGAGATITCADGQFLTMPAAFEGQPFLDGGVVSVNSLTGTPPGPLMIDACYTRPPRRYRAYRLYFKTVSCGSLHETRTVIPSPATAEPLDQIPSIASVGTPLDYVDLVAGDLEEDFIDPSPEESRPFPDPDFADYTTTLNNPFSSEARLDFAAVFSPPASFLLRDASYMVRPRIPVSHHAAGVRFSYRTSLPGDAPTVTLTSRAGEQRLYTLPPTFDWAQGLVAVPDGFDLTSVMVTMQDGNIDDLVIDIESANWLGLPEEPPACPCAADFDASGGTPDAGDIDVFFAAWLAGDPAADTDCSGGTPDVGDIDVFFGEWLAGGC